MKRLLVLVGAIATVPIALAGVFEMEGILVFILLGPLMLLIWRLSGVAVPHLAWVSWIVAVALLAITVTVAVMTMNARGTDPELTWYLAVLLVAYEIAVLLTITGSIWNVVRHIKVFRGPAPTA